MASLSINGPAKPGPLRLYAALRAAEPAKVAGVQEGGASSAEMARRTIEATSISRIILNTHLSSIPLIRGMVAQEG